MRAKASVVVETRAGEVSAFVSKVTTGQRTEVTYQAKSRADLTGPAFDIRIPGVASFEGRFVSDDVTTENAAQRGCKPAHLTLEHGYLIGSITFDGERGYTVAHAKKVQGTVDRIPEKVCRKLPPKHDPHAPSSGKEEAESESGERDVEVIAAEPRRRVSLVAEQLEFTERKPVTVKSILIANAATRSRGVLASHVLIDIDAPPSSITVPAPGTPLSEATVAAPSPFSGSATFRLASPTKASWRGNLAVELPGLGRVPLTGPHTISGLCESGTCTKTLPRSPSGSSTVEFQTIS